MRRPSPEERRLISHLATKAGILVDIDKLLVTSMSDGGMGSLSFTTDSEVRRFGRVGAACEFDDEDGITVIASLNLDQNDELLELDMWKVDFSELIRWPEEGELRDHPVCATPNREE